MGQKEIISFNVLIIILLIAGCASVNGDVKIGKEKIEEIYNHAFKEGSDTVMEKLKNDLIMRDTYGFTKPYVPVILPPEVRRVWIPDHINEEGDLVSGHWVYMKLRESNWFIENYKQEKKDSYIPRKEITEQKK